MAQCVVSLISKSGWQVSIPSRNLSKVQFASGQLFCISITKSKLTRKIYHRNSTNQWSEFSEK